MRYRFERNLASPVQRLEHDRIVGARERTDDLGDPPGFQQRGQTDMPVAGIVVDHRQTFGALVDEGVHEIGGIAGIAKATDVYRGAVRNAVERVRKVWHDLVDHCRLVVKKLFTCPRGRCRGRGRAGRYSWA